MWVGVAPDHTPTEGGCVVHALTKLAVVPVLVAAATTLGGCTAGAIDDPVASASPTVAPTTAAPTVDPGTPTPTPPAPAQSAGPTATESEPAPPPVADTAHPTLTYAGHSPSGSAYQLAGVVTDVIEDGGTCTFRLSSGSATIERTQTGVADASSTSCGSVDVAAAELSAGTWDATLVYAGARGSGTSPALTVVVR